MLVLLAVLPRVPVMRPTSSCLGPVTSVVPASMVDVPAAEMPRYPLVVTHGVYMNQVLGAPCVPAHGKPMPVAVSPPPSCIVQVMLTVALRDRFVLSPLSVAVLVSVRLWTPFVYCEASLGHGNVSGTFTL